MTSETHTPPHPHSPVSSPGDAGVVIKLSREQIAALRRIDVRHNSPTLREVVALIDQAEAFEHAVEFPADWSDDDIRTSLHLDDFYNATRSVPDVAGRDVLPPDYHPGAERARAINWRPWLRSHGIDF